MLLAHATSALAGETRVLAWGSGSLGLFSSCQVGEGTDVPVAICGLGEAGSEVVAVSSGSTSLALLAGGTVWAWGDNQYGELGVGDFTGPEQCERTLIPCSRVPVEVKGLHSVVAISAGNGYNLALLEDGTVMAWGLNSSGELGDGTDTGPEQCSEGVPCSTVPIPVDGLSEVGSITAAGPGSGQMNFAVLRDGQVMAWGYGASAGMFGLEDSEDVTDTPVHVAGLSGIATVAVGSEYYALALRRDGTVLAWGNNIDGQRGNGEYTTQNGWEASATPTLVPGLEHVSAISAGFNPVALLQDGGVMTWGYNYGGELGLGSTTGPEACDDSQACSTHPVTMPTLANVRAIAAGDGAHYALLEDGTTLAWGQDARGELGIGCYSTDGYVDEPTEVAEEASEAALTPCASPQATRSSARLPLAQRTSESGSAGIQSISSSGSATLALADGQSPARRPSVTSLTPSSGPEAGGTPVTITGRNLAGAAEVKFGATAVPATCVASACEAVAPRGKGVVDVTVTTASGTSAIAPADRYTYVQPPIVTKLSPKTGPAVGGTQVTITGENLSGATGVKFGPVRASAFDVKSATSLVADSPAGTSGPVEVTVTTTGGTSAPTSKVRFTYGKPTVTGVSATHGPKAAGQVVTITGSGFAPGDSATTILFGKTPGTTVECGSTSTCTATTPASAKAGPVNVIVVVGTAKSKTNPADQYSYE